MSLNCAKVKSEYKNGKVMRPAHHCNNTIIGIFFTIRQSMDAQ